MQAHDSSVRLEELDAGRELAAPEALPEAEEARRRRGGECGEHLRERARDGGSERADSRLAAPLLAVGGDVDPGPLGERAERAAVGGRDGIPRGVSVTLLDLVEDSGIRLVLSRNEAFDRQLPAIRADRDPIRSG
jgi:hypothetical protein